MAATYQTTFPISKDHTQVTGGPTTVRLTPFDQRHYRKLIVARGETIRRVIAKLKPALSLSTALDAGCGVGVIGIDTEY